MQWFKQSTAASLIVGPILDSTGAEYASAVIGDLSISKNGATLTALASAATLTYIANGYYTLALTTGNTDTLGRADISCNKATYQMPPRELMVLPATVYDALTTNATTAAGGLGDIQRMAGTVLTARDIGASVLLSSGTGTGQVTLTSGRVNADLTHINTAAVSTSTAQLGVNVVNFGGSAGTFASGVPAVNATQFGGATVTATTSVTFPAASTVATTTGAVGSVTGAVGSVTGAVGSVTGNVGGNVTGSVGSVVGNVGGNVTGSVGSVATGGITAASLAADAITAAKVAADVSAEIADAVWDEVLSGHLTAGSTGAGLNAAGSAGDPWSTALPGAYSAGSAGYIVGTNLNATVSSRSTYAGGDTSGTTTLLSRIPSSLGGVISMGDSYDGSGVLNCDINGAITSVSGNVGGDVSGKVLGGGAGTIAGTGVWAVDSSGAALATAANLATLTAYVDTEVAAIKAKTDNLPASPAAVGSAMTLTSGERDSIAAALLDLANGVETSYTVRQALRAIAAACAGNATGAGTGTELFKALGNSGTTRITNSGDTDGNRTITLNL